MRTIITVLLSVAIGTLPAQAEPWSGILSPTRGIDWSDAGAEGITSRTAICQTFSPGVTAAQINAALASCPSGQVVKLNAGTYNLSSGITITNKSNVTLRGAGPDATFLKFTGSVGCVLGSADICVFYDRTNPNGEYSASWTGGYAKGSTSITLSNTTGLKVGSLLVLDQLNDPLTDNREIWMCENGPDDNIPGTPMCAIEGATGFGRPGRTQAQHVIVTSINGNTVGISPGLYMPNWRAAQSPGAWWFNSTVSGVGIEDLSLDNTSSNSFFNLEFGGAHDCWVKNIRSLNSNRAHILGYVTSRITVRDSYFYGTLNALSQSYGSETDMSSAWLFENNIYQHITGPMQPGQQGSGMVYGHNFSLDDYYTNAQWMQASAYAHTAGINYILFEGNDGTGFTADAIHGTSHFITGFRNHWPGWEPGKNSQTVPVLNYAYNRYFNFIGNVLGRGGYHTTYECNASTATDSCASGEGRETQIWSFGFSGNQEYAPGVNNDTLVAQYVMRWGNFDVVNNSVRFVNSEVPSGL